MSEFFTRTWGLVVWAAVVVGAALAPGLRGADVGLDRVIARVDLGAAILGQAAAIVTYLLLVHVALHLVRRARPWPLAVLAVAPLVVPGLLLISAQRLDLPAHFLLSGALATWLSTLALTFSSTVDRPRRSALFLLSTALFARTAALFLVRDRPDSSWLPPAELAATSFALALGGLAYFEMLRQERRSLPVSVGILGLAVLASASLHGATLHGADRAVVVVGRGLGELVGPPQGVPLALVGFVVGAALLVALRGLVTRRGERFGSVALVALLLLLPLGPLSLAALALGALGWAMPDDTRAGDGAALTKS